MPPWFREHLACPDCQAPLGSEEAGTRCGCGFVIAAGRPADLRPQRPVERTLPVRLGSHAHEELAAVPVERPAITYSGPAAVRDSSELFSAAAPWLKRGGRLLDLGCGPRDQAAPAEHYGLAYAGVDFTSEQADLRADAHAIPFRDATFDAVLSYAVFEHLYHPHLAAAEVARVLKPGGVFFGAVSLGEPFHDSYFHHSALGLLSILSGTGLRTVRLWPSYDTLHALATMGRYPKAQRLLIEAVYRFGTAFPFLAPRRHFRWSAREKAVDALHRAASVCFLAEKVAS
jgi:SAM-dependent methyltransferase